MLTLFDLPEPQKPEPPIPRWITNAETELGAPLTLASGKAIPHKCPTCGAWTLTGYDAHIMAAQATVDPFLATPKDELAAVLLKIPTYQLWGTPPRYELQRRHQTHRLKPYAWERFKPANPGVTNVVIAHTCKPPLAKTRIPRSPKPTDYPENPPF